MPLLAADGQSHLTQEVIPLTSATVQLFNDGRLFLKGLAILRQLRVAVVCRYCEAHGGACGVTAIHKPDENVVFMACAHRPLCGRVKMDKPLSLDPLLLALGWDLRCSACHYPLRGANAPTATTLIVSCPCTKREYRYPVA